MKNKKTYQVKVRDFGNISVLLDGKWRDVESRSGVGYVVRFESKEWKGNCIVLCDKNGNEYNAPVLFGLDDVIGDPPENGDYVYAMV
jgi:hypothetical protein